MLMIKGPGVSDVLIARHQGSAMLSFWFMEATGVFSLIALWHSQRDARTENWNVAVVLLLSLLTVGLMARTGNTGGDIRHAEVRDAHELSANGTVIGRHHRIPPIRHRTNARQVYGSNGLQ